METHRQEAAHQSPEIPELLGVWRRSLLVTADGARDEASDVYWLQSRTLCGDIRREPVADGSPSPTAFAGRLTKRGGIFRWERELASYAAVDTPDEGWLAWEGGALREDGVHSPYLEIWQPMAKPGRHDFAVQLRHDRDGRTVYLLSIGAYLFIAQSALPGARDDGASFAFAGIDQAGTTLKLQAGVPFEAELLARLQEAAAALAGDWSTATMGGWSVAAWERPYLLSDLGTAHF